MTVEKPEGQGKPDCSESGLEIEGSAQQVSKEPTIRELVENFKQQPGSDRLIARWQQPIPLK